MRLSIEPLEERIVYDATGLGGLLMPFDLLAEDGGVPLPEIPERTHDPLHNLSDPQPFNPPGESDIPARPDTPPPSSIEEVAKPSPGLEKGVQILSPQEPTSPHFGQPYSGSVLSSPDSSGNYSEAAESLNPFNSSGSVNSSDEIPPSLFDEAAEILYPFK